MVLCDLYTVIILLWMIDLSYHLPEGFQSFIWDVFITLQAYLLDFHFLLFVWAF